MSNRAVLISGLALLVLLIGGGAWLFLGSNSAGEQPVAPTPVAGVSTTQAVDAAGWVHVYTPQPTATQGANAASPTQSSNPSATAAVDVSNPPLQDTPTLIPGGATFTALPANTPVAANQPRVLGITAGVGMSSGDVGGTAPLAVTFSTAMNHPSAQAAFELRPAIAGNFTWQANTLLFTPDQPLQPSTAYTVTVATSARSQGGQGVTAPLSASFKTAPPPSILRTLPSEGASDVPTNTIVTLTFNRPMIPLTALSNQPDPARWVTISPAVAGHWVWLGTSAVGFRADTGFLPATAYTVAAKAGWPDANGVAMQAGTAAHFTTLRPSILSVEPVNGENKVGIDAPIVVRFNMPLDHASVQSAVKLPAAGAAAWSADSTVVTFTLGSLLNFGQQYTVSVDGSVQTLSGGASPLAGSSQSNSWRFTTADRTVVDHYYPDSDANGGVTSPSNTFGFAFNNPLAPGQDVAGFFSVDPKPQGYMGQLKVEGSQVYTTGVNLLPNTTYKFELRAGLKDKWGFAVQPSSWQVKIGPPPPNLGPPPSVSLPGGAFHLIYSQRPSVVQLQAANVDTVTLRLYTLSEDDVRKTLQGISTPDAQPYGTLARTWDVAVPNSKGSTASTFYPTLSLDGKSDRLPAGYYILLASVVTPYDSQPLQSRSVLIVGKTGAVLKNDGQNLMVWAVDLKSGQPVPGYKLRMEQLQSDKSPISKESVTGKDGIARFPIDAKSNTGSIAVWGEQQGDVLLASSAWSGNLSFGYPGNTGSDTTRRGALYADRPIYRAGQTVYFRGVLRLDDDAAYSLPQAGTTLQLYAYTYSSQGQITVFTGTATLSALGTFSGQFVLPADAPTGGYTLDVNLSGADPNSNSGLAAAGFQVEEYRKPDFQVAVTTGGEAVHGEPVTATIAASYYFGGPLSNVTTTVNLQSAPYYFSWSDPDTGESYTFGNNPPIIYDFYGMRPPTPDNNDVQSFTTRTGKDGLATVDVSRYVTTTEGSRLLTVEGQVLDLSNQAVASSSTVTVHQGSFYIGLRTSDYLAQAKQPLTATIRTVDSLDRKVLPNTPVKLSFARREWAAPTDSSGQWTENDVQVGTANVTTDGKGRAIYLFTPPSGGEYVIHAESADSLGNKIATTLDFYAYSSDPGYVPWRYDNPQQVQLVADKQQYKIGDTAKILVTSPFTQATGLLTVERGHVRRYRIVQLQGGAPTIDVPLEGGDVPNVFIGLTLLGAGQPVAGAPAGYAGYVALRQGYVSLSLDTSGEKINVSIEPQGKGPFEPGSTANVKVTTRDSSGHAVPGELSLAVVDEAIYALAGDHSASLFDTFWSERGLSVSTASSFTREGPPPVMPATGGGLVSLDAPPSRGEAVPPPGQTQAGGGRAAPQPAAPQKVRVDFQDTAFWRSNITTGADGSATVAVPLPDNLTTWRLTAQGVNGATQAGAASVPLTVTQPLLLRPVQPRFFTTGDNPHPQAIIHNNTGSVLNVEASLVVSGAITLDVQPSAVQTLTLQPGTQTVVTWSAQIGGKGGADVANLRYWVHTVGNAGTPDYREDAVASQLPVEPFAAPETVATSGEVDGTQKDESIFLPYSVSPLLGEMVVQVSPSLAAAATESIHFVESYPYDSTDMAVSRFLPLVVLEKTYNDQALHTPYSAQIPGILQTSLSRLRDLQQPDGGWGWWERGPSSWWETGYAVQGLIAARDAGYSVPADMLQRGIQRLQAFQQDNNTQGLDATYHLNMRAYTLYVLSQAGAANASMKQEGSDLASQASRLSTHALAWLAMALDKMGMKTESQSVLNTLEAGARQSSTVAHWEEGARDYYSMGTDNRATALAIDALVTLSPNDPLTPKAVRWLMTAEKDGHWLSTQETSISLIALAHYIAASKELGANYNWQVSAFDNVVGGSVANSSNITQTATLHIPVAGLPQNTLGTLDFARSNDTGKMYYQVSLRYYVPGQVIQARSEGLAITRSYYAADGTTPIKEVNAGDLVRVRLNIVVPETAHYVNVTDPLPAGLEGVNGSLNTTSFTERPPNPMGTNAADEGSSYSPWWRWGPFTNVEMRDDSTVLFADYLAPGTYVYEYYARATTPGIYMALPARAELLYYPDIFGHSDGGQFTVR